MPDTLRKKKIKLNKVFLESDFKIVAGLLEPHFRAGFSGGRKSVCPGIASLETLENFHGYEFLAFEKAVNAVLENNPCHMEALSVAKASGVDCST